MIPFLKSPIITGDCHPELPGSHLFHRTSFGGGSMSCEEAQVLYSLVQILKPQIVAESGTETGLSAAYMALACKHNGFGMVHTAEICGVQAENAQTNILDEGLLDWVHFHIYAALDMFETFADHSVGFALIDTHIHLRLDEVCAIWPKIIAGGIVAIHDTSPAHPMAGDADLLKRLQEFTYDMNADIFHLPSPRGLTLIQKP